MQIARVSAIQSRSSGLREPQHTVSAEHQWGERGAVGGYSCAVGEVGLALLVVFASKVDAKSQLLASFLITC